jgi:hypothetical protein
LGRNPCEFLVLKDRILRFKLPRKEVIQPHLPVQLPCYDFVPVTSPTFGSSFLTVRSPTSGVTDFHDVTGGVYKARERIQRTMADARLLATPTSCRRVAADNLNCGCFSAICSALRLGYALLTPIVACVSPRI